MTPTNPTPPVGGKERTAKKKRMYAVYCGYTDLHGMYTDSLDSALDIIKGDISEVKDDEVDAYVVDYRIEVKMMSQRAINRLGEYEP